MRLADLCARLREAWPGCTVAATLEYSTRRRETLYLRRPALNASMPIDKVQ